MSAFVTVDHPGPLRLIPEHQSADGRRMVYMGDDALFWISPETAAQWIEELKKVQP